jgi:hypothetical protein
MPVNQNAWRRSLARVALSLSLLLSLAAALLLPSSAQAPSQKSPAAIQPQLLVVPESVLLLQWPHTLGLVNAPSGVSLVNPGQCLRFGIVSTGDGRDPLLHQSKLSFTLHFADHEQSAPPAAITQSKQVKPEGGDFVTGALGAAGIKNPLPTMASLGFSDDRWCVPADAQDGTATVKAEVETPQGKQSLETVSIKVESFATGGEKPFEDDASFNLFLSTYYRSPHPARLLRSLEYAIASQTKNAHSGVFNIVLAFTIAALRADPVAAHDLLQRLPSQPALERNIGFIALRQAGYDIDTARSALASEDRAEFDKLPPPEDPFDFAPTNSLFSHLDMLWATFQANGRLEPVQKISSALAWRADYDAFDKLHKTPNHSFTLTPSMARGVAYTAAGWSLGSFQKQDPLVADYIQFLQASEDTPPAIRTEIQGLSTNAAFQKTQATKTQNQKTQSEKTLSQ